MVGKTDESAIGSYDVIGVIAPARHYGILWAEGSLTLLESDQGDILVKREWVGISQVKGKSLLN